MAESTAIEWTDHTFNPWVGCTKISPGCDHCYAEGWARRTGGAALWQGERRRTTAAYWRQPLKWNRAAQTPLEFDEITGEAVYRALPRVFCASLADVFDNQVPPEWRDDLWELIRATPHLDWQLLTKRPQNIAGMLPEDWSSRPGERWRPAGYPNVWLGCTVENQTEAVRRLPHLLSNKARVHFVSYEPALEAVDLERVHLPIGMTLNALTGYYDFGSAGSIREAAERMAKLPGPPNGSKVDWVICGGESGPSARPMALEWARHMERQCFKFATPFLFKQWGEHDATGQRVGKKAAGRLLDGVEHNGFPGVPQMALERLR